jgi:nicotinate-nucleotide--dimethylbenzimidazole phosphoribosyltransferase
VRALLLRLPGEDAEAKAKADAREPTLTKPAGALGRLEGLSAWLAAWQGRHPPRVERGVVQVFAGNHGVTAKRVSAFPPAVTAEMVANFERGGAAINQMCRAFGWRLGVRAVDLDRPTRDFTEDAAMSEEDCVAAFALGMESVDGTADVLCLGEMGIGNTTAAAAVCHGLYAGAAADWTGPGTGVGGEALARKTAVVAEAVRRHGGPPMDGLEALRRLGGRELAAIAGAVAAARILRVPVVLDGYVCTAAAAPLAAVQAGALAHCQAGHASAEPGHRRLLDRLGFTPLLDLGMRLGEGTGAALALNLLKAAAACHAGMATFAEAGVSGKSG